MLCLLLLLLTAFLIPPLPDPRVDFNKDRSVSAKEMQRWIMEKTEEHFQEATKENKNSFHAVDPDGDGEGGRNAGRPAGAVRD